MFQIEALAAREGDCLWVEWTHGRTRRRMLIDGGPGTSNAPPPPLAARIASQPANERHFDLVVCTHIDSDHIGGLIGLFNRPPTAFNVGDVWFNGRQHLNPDMLGTDQGERLGTLLRSKRLPWNLTFGGRAVVVTDHGPLPQVTLPGLTLTLLSPTWRTLRDLARKWPSVVAEAERSTAAPPDLLGSEQTGPLHELARAPYVPDGSEANGSSIAFLAEHEDGGRLLLGADAHAEVLVEGLDRLHNGRRVPVDLCKAPHHGSDHNLSLRLIRALDCEHWLFSTNGARHGHPSRTAIGRLVTARDNTVLWFNYRSETTREFARPSVAQRYKFRAMHPTEDSPGIVVPVVTKATP